MNGIREAVEKRPVVWYFTLAFVISWSWWIPLALSGRKVDVGADPTHFPGLIGPAVAAFAVTAIVSGRRGLRDLLARSVRWRVPIRWYLWALSPMLIFAATYVYLDVSGDPPSLQELGRFGGLPEIGVLGVFLLLTVVNGYGEETGWRGFALPRLQKAHSTMWAALVIALFWIAWHTPNFVFLETYRGLGKMLPGFVIGVVFGSIFLAWLYNRSNSSIFIVTLWHGVYNLTSGTSAARGVPSAVVSTFVMVTGAVIAIQYLRERQTKTRPRSAAPRGLAT